MKPSVPSRQGRILQAVWSGAAVRVLTSGLTLISLPLAVRYLGPERYGVWTTIATTAVWINLLDLGIANTVTNKISQAYALDDKQSAARYFTNALALTGGIAAACGLVCAWLSPRINWVALFHVSRVVGRPEIEHTMDVALGLTLLGLPCNLASKVLGGYQEVHRNNFAVATGAVASVCGLAWGILGHVSMPALFVMSVGCLTFANLIMLMVIVLWQKPWLMPRPAMVDGGALKELLSSGSSFLLIQVAAVIVFSSDNLIVSHYLGASEVTPYTVTWRLVGLSALLQSLIFPALWPAYAEAHARGDYAWIRRTFAMTMKGTVALNAVCVVLLALCGRSLIRVWAGAAAVPTLGLLLAMGLWAILSGFMSVESCLLAALNCVREQAWLSIIAAAVNVGLSLALVCRIGSVGVIAGTIVSYLIVLVVPQTMIVRRVWKTELQRGNLLAPGLRESQRREADYAVCAAVGERT